jgi:hypothetical protein
MALHPLTALRLRLTAWYAGTSGLILALLGGGLFWVVRSQVSQRLDASLKDATSALMRANVAPPSRVTATPPSEPT